MARPKNKGLVEVNSEQSNEDKRTLRFVDLVETIRKSRSREKSDHAFGEIVNMLKSKIERISYKFQIPGCTFDDVYQEALFALRYKAVKDYNKDRSTQQAVSPFEKFAALCIRRHLSTKLKSAYQNKKKIWTTSISLDQDRSDSSSGDSLCLMDIVTDNEEDIPDQIDRRDSKKRLYRILYARLSEFEREIFLLYCQRLSYGEIVKKANGRRRKDKINAKSVDNALSRIKLKGRKVFDLLNEI